MPGFLIRIRQKNVAPEQTEQTPEVNLGGVFMVGYQRDDYQFPSSELQETG